MSHKAGNFYSNGNGIYLLAGVEFWYDTVYRGVLAFDPRTRVRLSIDDDSGFDNRLQDVLADKVKAIQALSLTPQMLVQLALERGKSVMGGNYFITIAALNALERQRDIMSESDLCDAVATLRNVLAPTDRVHEGPIPSLAPEIAEYALFVTGRLELAFSKRMMDPHAYDYDERVTIPLGRRERQAARFDDYEDELIPSRGFYDDGGTFDDLPPVHRR